MTLLKCIENAKVYTELQRNYQKELERVLICTAGFRDILESCRHQTAWGCHKKETQGPVE